MGSAFLDIKDPQLRHAADLGLASLRRYVGKTPDGVPSADDRYREDHLACAEFLMGSSPAVEEIFRDTDERVAAFEKRHIAMVYLAWPAIADLTPAELANEIGNIAATLALEIASFESPAEWQTAHISDIAKKAMRVEDAFLKLSAGLRQPAKISDEMMGFFERELSAMLADRLGEPGAHLDEIREGLRLEPSQYVTLPPKRADERLSDYMNAQLAVPEKGLRDLTHEEELSFRAARLAPGQRPN